MRAGELDRRLTIYRAAMVDDGFGERPDWDNAQNLGTVWASKSDISDRERWQAGQVQASVTTRFQVRYSALTAGITSSDRVECEGRTYEVVGVPKELGRREGIEITGAARAD